MDFGPLLPANNSIVREMQPQPGLDPGRPAGPPIYPSLPAHESAVGEYVRVLIKRKWIVIGCLATIFSVVAIASLKMAKVYEAKGTIEINKPDSSLNFQNSTTFSLDYYDPTELETELRILQSDLLALQVIRTLNLDRQPEFGGSNAPHLPRLTWLQTPCRPIPGAPRRCWEGSRAICMFRSARIPASSRFTMTVRILRWPQMS